uniref:assimilatory sulfite reductase (ferredoxin) n=1 Tax=Grammatophora oceanica TaxID=210454 RepID=A0A7S1Y212_9STRA|mmetsp:Transcript_19674/g.29124  ORF Transcript_19674/g.29124 Transcript_19674/m.29124 type:complete len:629 (+) Transcript_19674:131-2017(+)|eukprot:CAMPEP_0194048482 /NCGR_PEP_ID=MMETSP0009_2-20130614/27419_1 /TAXON_ID=210454 /ORGANISM="Grammatophora oceanica, Strain CCMP 410" /LENGTH=628 /DNA_ID=CAMNT_0038694347 /DNA_START=105 /DNA_END=1991 /DNA_ORIENTATION=+
MKIGAAALVLLGCNASAFVIPTRPATRANAMSSLSMVLEMPKQKKKISKLETLKVKSDHLIEPLKQQLTTEEIGISKDAYQILKYHGSYQQSNREIRGKKDFQFMLRLKQPAGELPADLYRLLDDLSAKMGQGDLRATTRQCFQMHGIMKGNLKTVISSIMNIGSSTVGACGDVSRNVMTTPAPFDTPEYNYAREYSKVFAHLFRPMTPAFSEIWLDGEKAASVETWSKEVAHHNVDQVMTHDNGRGIVLNDSVEPLYGDRYLPRKFKIGVTVPGDNSLDIYTNDIGCVVICNDKGELEGFNVMVGGGMGRSHNKESTFARAADHLGFVPKEDIMEVLKAILASQRDHGNRDVRANARMKYLVHTLGIDNFKTLVESYFGKKIAPWKPMAEWKYNDWMGWWEQGDGKLFYGLHVDNGRVKDEGDFRLKSALRVLVDKYNLSMILSPTQSLIFRDIDPKDKAGVEAVLAEHGIKPLEEVDPLNRLAMACPALPLCGLAQTEAERIVPDYLARIRSLLNKMNIPEEEILIRMTGCPNGCARPYMAELGFVGDGPKSYQVWLGGSPVLTRTAWPFRAKMPTDKMEETMEPILAMFIEQRQQFEAFGDFCHRVGADGIEKYSGSYKLGSVKA